MTAAAAQAAAQNGAQTTPVGTPATDGGEKKTRKPREKKELSDFGVAAQIEALLLDYPKDRALRVLELVTVQQKARA